MAENCCCFRGGILVGRCYGGDQEPSVTQNPVEYVMALTINREVIEKLQVFDPSIITVGVKFFELDTAIVAGKR